MKKLIRNPEKFDVVELFCKIGSGDGFSINNSNSRKNFYFRQKWVNGRIRRRYNWWF
jgi:hypothetical protein